MISSPDISEIAKALSKAQGEMGPAEMDRANPHFKSKYATLSSLIHAAKKPLASNGLAIVQTLLMDVNQKSCIRTTLIHASGQWLSDEGIPLILDKNNMQGLGSAITYAKRFGMASMLGLVGDEDDDGHAASHTTNHTQQTPHGVVRMKPASGGSTTYNIAPTSMPSLPEDPEAIGNLPVNFGKFKGRLVKDIKLAEGMAYVKYIKEESRKKNEIPSNFVLIFEQALERYWEAKDKQDGSQIPF